MNADFAKALAAFQAECKPILKQSEAEVQGKSAKGRDYSYTYRYADLPTIMAVVQPLMDAHGFVFSSKTIVDGETVMLRGTLFHVESKHGESSDLPLNKAVRPQDLGALLTFYRRYLLCAMLNIIVTGEDEDAGSIDDIPMDQQKQGLGSDDPRWNGPLTKTELKKSIRELHTQLEAAKTRDGLTQLRDAYASVITQCQADKPDWWNDIKRGPNDWVPGLKARLQETEDRIDAIERGLFQ